MTEYEMELRHHIEYRAELGKAIAEITFMYNTYKILKNDKRKLDRTEYRFMTVTGESWGEVQEKVLEKIDKESVLMKKTVDLRKIKPKEEYGTSCTIRYDR